MVVEQIQDFLEMEIHLQQILHKEIPAVMVEARVLWEYLFRPALVEVDTPHQVFLQLPLQFLVEQVEQEQIFLLFLELHLNLFIWLMVQRMEHRLVVNLQVAEVEELLLLHQQEPVE